MPLRRRELFGKEGELFFVTTSFHRQRSLLLNDKYYHIILDSLCFLKQKYKFEIVAYVVMDSHLHLILFVQSGTALSDIMRDFKKFTAYKTRKQLEKDKEFDLLNSLRMC
jgi:REP element-mobilizing transposase RayT